MEFFNLYDGTKLAYSMIGASIPQVFYYALGVAFAVWLGLFVLQGFGLYAMASNRGMKDKWKAFVPFLNVHYIGKLSGDCYFLSQRVKRAGLYAMLAQIAVTLIAATVAASEIYLCSMHGTPKLDEWGSAYWTGLQGFSLTVFQFYNVGSYLLPIVQLVYEILMLVLVLGLYKKYNPQNYMALGFLELFVPLSRYIVIFVLRNRKAVDYDAYMRARREAYMRYRQQNQNPYGNPYGNPYNTPYGNPYANANSPKNAPKPEDPFSEFDSDKTKGEDCSKSKDDSDEFFS